MQFKRTHKGKLLTGLFLAIMLVQLSSCGWRLRGSYEFPKSMERVFVQGAARYSELGNAIHNAFQGSNVQLEANAGQATAILLIFSDKSDKRILSTDSSGRASEYEVTYRLGFKLVDAKGKLLVSEQQIALKREYRFDPDNVLATDDEVERLKQDMLRAAVQQMLRRINVTLISK